MTQAIDDLVTLFKTFNHATVNTAITAGGGTEQLTADPSIELRNVFMETPPARNANGNVILTGEQEGTSIELGEDRHVPYFITGYIYYESQTDKDSLVIMSIKHELRSLMNVANQSTSRNYRRQFVTPTTYNNIPQAGRIDFTVNATKLDESAIT